MKSIKKEKIECECQEHHKHECYFGAKPCLHCKAKNCGEILEEFTKKRD